MSNEQALLNCTFGWGKTCTLYYDSIEIAGKSYNLKDLTSIHPSYRNVFGVPSARLEISFGPDHLILRGIADLDVARLMVSHLQPYCSTMPHPARAGTRSGRARNLARAQARAWERTNKIPAITALNDEFLFSTDKLQPLRQTDDPADIAGFHEETPMDEPLSLDAVPKAPVEDTSLTPGETLEAFTQIAQNLSTYTSPLPTETWQPLHTPRFQPPLHSVHLIHPEQKFDSASMPIPVVKSSVLPIIHVPVRLQHGECAHYSIGSTLCSDRISQAERATYPSLDNGLLILTNRRVLYIGKRCQFTLAYTHLWYVSLLHTAIALHIEGQFRRIIIEVEHPQEWASRIELLSFIARRARPREEAPTLAVTAIPGLNMTVKRRAVRPSRHKKTTVIEENATVPLLTERVGPRIVDAETIEISEAPELACADHETQDFSAMATPHIPEETDHHALAARRASQPLETRSGTTQALDLTHLETQEFTLQPDTPDAPTQALLPSTDLTRLETQEFILQPEANDSKIETNEKTTQGLQTDLAAIASIRLQPPTDAEPEVTTSGLSNPDLPLAILARQTGKKQAKPADSTDDDDDRTICLHDRKLSQLRTVEIQGVPVSDRLPDLARNTRRTRRGRVPQHHS